MELHLRDLMNPQPSHGGAGRLAGAAAAPRCDARDVSSAVVVRDGAVVGILTERDLARAVRRRRAGRRDAGGEPG